MPVTPISRGRLAVTDVSVPAEDGGNPWVVVIILCVAQSMVVLDATIVNVALPSIQRGPLLAPQICSG